MAMSREAERLLRRLRAQIDALTPRLQREFLQALASLQASVSLPRLEQALARRDAFAIHDLAGTLPLRLQPALATLRQVFLLGARAASEELARSAHIGIRFDARNPFASEAARQSGAKLVVQVTAETRQAIRTVIARAFADGIPPRQAATLIRPLIGLTTHQATGVVGTYRRAIEQGASRRAAQQALRAAAGKALRRRALTIARTEIIKASVDGQLADWQQAQRQGLLSARALKVWIVTPDDRLCPYCQAMDGRTALVSQEFTTGLFGRVAGPPLHPNCRCAVGIQFERRAA